MEEESSSDDSIIDDNEQEKRWKVEASLIRLLKLRRQVTTVEFINSAKESWITLGRSDVLTDEYIISRIQWLVKREWMTMTTNGVYVINEAM